MQDSSKNDQELAMLVQSGGVDFFGVLFNRYEAKIKRYAKKFIYGEDEINDAIQQIFTKAFVNINSFDSNRKFSSWLYRIAHNELVNLLKKKRHSFLPLFDLDVFLPRNFLNNKIADDIDAKNLKKEVERTLEKIEEKYREPLYLYYIEELPYKDISEIMKIPVSTVGVRITRAKKLMKNILKNENLLQINNL
jgi:RNA polymerase sigma-70 factor (ECF subfamily)